MSNIITVVLAPKPGQTKFKQGSFRGLLIPCFANQTAGLERFQIKPLEDVWENLYNTSVELDYSYVTQNRITVKPKILMDF